MLRGLQSEWRTVPSSFCIAVVATQPTLLFLANAAK